MMSRELQIIAAAITFMVLILGVFLYLKKVNTVSEEIQRNDEIIEENASDSFEKMQKETQRYVIDVDSNVDNWQTKETEFFVIKYPQKWHWMDYDMQFGGFITNNETLKDPWSDEMESDDIKLVMSMGPLNPFSDHIPNVVDRMAFEMEYDQRADKQKYSNVDCLIIEDSQFDLEYLCKYKNQGIYYYSKRFGIKNSSVDNGAILFDITASSENNHKIGSFFIERNY